MAKSRKLSKNRMLLEPIENGIDVEKRKQERFFALAERFRSEHDLEADNCRRDFFLTNNGRCQVCRRVHPKDES